MIKNWEKINSLGALKEAGWESFTIKEELRRNLIDRLRSGKPSFEGIIGFEDTVIPDIETAILSRHNMILLGLRGQAKTRISRLMIDLLDEYIPIVEGSDIMDDPYHPLSHHARTLIEEHGDDTPIKWVHRNERYTEKLATPDVTVADLIGDIDPIKAANLRLSFADERVIHFGLVPRSNRSLFVINELPDLQPRIQVALFNILQEGDIQIRGFKLHLPLNIQFVFTANPEDYTNRGSIVTPLKDRIESQVITHYPKSIEISRQITEQEADVIPEQLERVEMVDLAKDLIEQIAFVARDDEQVDRRSGVSARLTISAYENLVSTVERRALKHDTSESVRVSDFWGVVPSITGKVELVYEGEQEGALVVAQNLIGKSIKQLFSDRFPDPESSKKSGADLYSDIVQWFAEGNLLELDYQAETQTFRAQLEAVEGLGDLIDKLAGDIPLADRYFLMEFVLHALAEYSLLSKTVMDGQLQFKELFSSLFGGDIEFDDEE